MVEDYKLVENGENAKMLKLDRDGSPTIINAKTNSIVSKPVASAMILPTWL